MPMGRPAAVLVAAAVAVLSLFACEARPIAEGAGTLCTGCHGGTDAAAPFRATNGATSTSDRRVGAHQAHLASGAAACEDCHPVRDDIASPGHMDGKVDVAFGERAGGRAASWEPDSATCSVYCHGATLEGGSATRPVWTRVDGSQAACGSCHGSPPPAPHPASAACSGCHPSTVKADGTIDRAAAAHINGKIDVAADGATCGSCHGIPPPAPHVASTSCGSCHSGYSSTTVNAALHRNGTVDVSAAACGACHAIPPATGRHGKHVQEERITCGMCHAGFTASSAGPTHLNGTVEVSAPGWSASTQSCANACHGTEGWYGGD